jgi:hypothetical protein
MTATAQPPQHIQALRKANDVRLARAARHREIAKLTRQEGCRELSKLLADPPSEIESMAIIDLLQWVHRIGCSQARSILRHSGPMGERRQVRALTPRQRNQLAKYFDAAAEGWDRRNS